MDLTRLKEAEERFLILYPGGIMNPLMLEIAQKREGKHLVKLAQKSFSMEQFDSPSHIADSMGVIVGQSPFISLFEKVKLQEAIHFMHDNHKQQLSAGMQEFLYGNQRSGFHQITSVLDGYKMAKWPVLTVCPSYCRPYEEIFIHPVAARKVIDYYQLEGLTYCASPAYDFYRAYREHILFLKNQADPSLQGDNEDFCRFLIMSTNLYHSSAPQFPVGARGHLKAGLENTGEGGVGGVG